MYIAKFPPCAVIVGVLILLFPILFGYHEVNAFKQKITVDNTRMGVLLFVGCDCRKQIILRMVKVPNGTNTCTRNFCTFIFLGHL